MGIQLTLKEIKKKILLLKIYIFFAYGTSVFYFLFILIWFKLNGMTVAEIFAYNLVAVIVPLFFSNIWSKISDKIKNRSKFIILGRILQSIGLFIVIFNVTFLTMIIFAFFLYCVSNETQIVALFYELIDVRESLKKDVTGKKSREFTKFRIFGSIGWALGGPIAGLLILFFNSNLNSSYVGFQIIFSIAILINSVIVVYLFFISKNLENYPITIEEPEEKILTPKISIFKNKEYIYFLIVMFIFEMAGAIITSVKSIYAVDLGGNYFFVGLLAFTWAMCEVPLFFISAKLVDKNGYRLPMLIAFIFLMIKYFFYIFIITPETIVIFLLLETLNSFGILWPATTYAISNIFAKNEKAFGTSVYLTLMGVAKFLGNLLGLFLALIYNVGDDYLSYRVLFINASMINVLAIILLIIFQLSFKKRMKKQII